MDFYQELLLTGLISVLIAFLIGKIASIPVDDDEETDLASSAHIAAGSSANAVSVHPIAEKEIERNSPPGDACPSGVSFDDSDQAEALCFEVELQRLDLEKEEFSKEVEVGASKVDESSTKKVGDFVKKEELSVRDEKVLDSCGENAVENEDASAMDEKDGLLLHGEDDWEGIECSDLEKLFGVAAEFVASEKGGNAVCKLSNEVQLQLYGLHKVATEGPCYGPKPMALMGSARSKWHAWQRLGNISPEAAMEEYISLLANSIPGWIVHQTMAQPKDNDCKDPGAVEISQVDHNDLRSPSHSNSGTERLVGDSYPVKDATDAVATDPKFLNDGLTKLFLVNLLSPTRVAF
ncbi:acyl-CoA-binding domain-containing protein 3-like [Zingiber officinale]|uniref:acyl-CoA-binding domain-containing protein 3-like n=1 Tax=Zingiber officinale TaxID=94328 RepID=UPI001C4BDC3F|nr:acyl-CoA-binding domain-containing protein 3-like [Zingiber officinale]